MKQAMAQHMQKSVPAHLKSYQQDGRAFIPTHVEKAIVEHMQKSVPAHMKEYVGAYVQQNVTFPATGGAQPHAPISVPRTPRPVSAARMPVPQIPRQAGYTRPLGTPSTAELLKSVQATGTIPASPIIQPDQPTTPVPPAPPVQPGSSPDMYPQSPSPFNPEAAPGPHSTYDFIMNPEQPATPKKPLLPGSGGGAKSIAIRVGMVAGGLIVLLIIFNVVSGLLSGNGNQAQYIAVVQDQHELVHLTTAALEQEGISTSNVNFAATANLSLGTARGDMIVYLGKTGVKKIEPKILGQKISLQTDKQLADAAVASTYNQTFRELMKAKLQRYKLDLQQAYDKTEGPNGRKLLEDQFKQAELLEIQLNETAS